MANLLLIIGHVTQEHVSEMDFEIHKQFGSVIEGVRTVPAEFNDPEVYLLKNGVEVNNAELGKIKDEMRSTMIGKNQNGEPHSVVAVLWGTDTRNVPSDFSWAFDHEAVFHGKAETGDDDSPYVTFREN